MDAIQMVESLSDGGVFATTLIQYLKRHLTENFPIPPGLMPERRHSTGQLSHGNPSVIPLPLHPHSLPIVAGEALTEMEGVRESPITLEPVAQTPFEPSSRMLGVSSVTADLPDFIIGAFQQTASVTKANLKEDMQEISGKIGQCFTALPGGFRVFNRAKELESILAGIEAIEDEQKKRRGVRVTMTEMTVRLLVNWPNSSFPFLDLNQQESAKIISKMFRNHPLGDHATHLINSGMVLKDVLVRLCQQMDTDFVSFTSNHKVYGQFSGENLLGFLRRFLFLVLGLRLFFGSSYPDRTLLEMLCRGPIAREDRNLLERERVVLSEDVHKVYAYIGSYAKAGYVSISSRLGYAPAAPGRKDYPRGNHLRTGPIDAVSPATGTNAIAISRRRGPANQKSDRDWFERCVFCKKSHYRGECEVLRERNKSKQANQDDRREVDSVQSHHSEIATFPPEQTDKDPNEFLFVTLRIHGEDIEGKIDTGAYRTILPLRYAQRWKLDLTDELCHWGSPKVLKVSRQWICVVTKECHIQRRLAFSKDCQMPLFGVDIFYIPSPDVLLTRRDHRSKDLFCGCTDAVASLSTPSSSTASLTVAQRVEELRRTFPPQEGLAHVEAHKAPLAEKTVPLAVKTFFSNPLKGRIMSEILTEYEAMGSFSRINTATWTHAVMLVEKVEKASRPEDFRLVHCLGRLNENFRTLTSNFSIFEELPSKMMGMKTFAKIDLKKCFDFFPLHHESRQYFAFLGPQGDLWTLNSVPQGYKNAPAVVHSQIRSIVLEAALGPSATAVNHFDDIMVAAKDDESLFEALQVLLNLLVHKYNLRIHWAKSIFGVPEVEYLGYYWSSTGYRMPPDRALVLSKLRAPADVSEVRSFMAWANRYSRFCKSLQALLAPISDLLRAESTFEWTEELEARFKRTKEVIGSESVLSYPDWSAPFEVFLDWSKAAISASLEQEHGPLSFDGRKCKRHEQTYSSFDGEAAALRFALERYKDYFFGTTTTIWTDNRDLLVVNTTRRATSAKVERIRQMVQSFPDLTIKHISGSQNPADFVSRNLESGDNQDIEEALERRSLPSVCLVIRLKNPPDKGTQQESNESEFCPLIGDSEPLPTDPPTLSGLEHDSPLADEETIDDNVEVVIDEDEEEERPIASQDPYVSPIESWKWDERTRCLTRDGIICPTLEQRISLAHHYHSLSHAGVKTTLHNLAMRFWWPSMAADVRMVVKHCMVCRVSKSRKLEAGFSPWPDPESKMVRIHADHFTFRNHSILLLVDAFSEFIWAKTVPNLTEDTTMEILDDIFALFGKPKLLVADNGPGFGQRTTAMLMARGIHRASTIPDKPQSNGLAEWAVGLIKGTIKKLCAAFPRLSTTAALRRALEFQNKAAKLPLGLSPYELFFGCPPEDIKSEGEDLIAKYREIRQAVRRKRLTTATQARPKIGAQILVMSPDAKITLDPMPVVFTVLRTFKWSAEVTDGSSTFKVPFSQIRVLPAKSAPGFPIENFEKFSVETSSLPRAGNCIGLK